MSISLNEEQLKKFFSKEEKNPGINGKIKLNYDAIIKDGEIYSFIEKDKEYISKNDNIIIYRKEECEVCHKKTEPKAVLKYGLSSFLPSVEDRNDSTVIRVPINYGAPTIFTPKYGYFV